jgi:hypothetical protein
MGFRADGLAGGVLREGAQDLPTLEDLARAIAGGDPPQILISGLERLASGLAGSIRAQAAFPGRPELRKRLKAVAEAARLIEREISGSIFLSLLLGDDQHWTAGDQRWIEDESATVHGLQEIARRAELALSKVPQGKGRRMHYPRPEGITAMTQCALIISVAWCVARKEWPGMNNDNAKRACEMLWRIASRDRRRQSDEVWRDHLREAAEFRGKPQAKVIHKVLTGG